MLNAALFIWVGQHWWSLTAVFVGAGSMAFTAWGLLPPRVQAGMRFGFEGLCVWRHDWTRASGHDLGTDICWMCDRCRYCAGKHDCIEHRGLCPRHKEDSCSTNPSPTSGTSPSPAPSNSPAAQILAANPGLRWIQPGYLSASASTSPSESPSLPSPARRTEPVIGYRGWVAHEQFRVGIGDRLVLHPHNSKFGVWTPGVNTADCHAQAFYVYPQSEHPAPDPLCNCGFWVLSDLDRVPFEKPPPRPAGDVHETARLAVTDSKGMLAYVHVTWSDGTETKERLPDVLGPSWQLVGAVMGWGRVIQHGSAGWRAEKARIVALLDCKAGAEQLEITKRAAAEYGVPVLGRDDLERYVTEFGERLPELAGKAGW